MRSRGGPATELRALLARDDARRALLLERLEPGTTLWSVEDDERATAIGAEVLQALHREPPPAHPFRALDEQAARWAETIPADWRSTGRAFPAALVEVAVDACRTLPGTDAGSVVLHQDFHGGNVLYSDERGWLAIDPKPLVGDPAFDAASLLRDRRWLLGGSGDRRRIERRLDAPGRDDGSRSRAHASLGRRARAGLGRERGRSVEQDMVRCAELLAERLGSRDVGWNDWIRDGGEVEPSLYAADFRRLGEQVDDLLEAGCRVFHFDCGDGHFVPPVTIGPVVLRSIAPGIHAAGGVLDCHLMVDDPAHHFEEFAESGADSVTFHVEAADDIAAVAEEARRLGLAVGLAFNPETSPAAGRGGGAGCRGRDRALHEHPSRLLGSGVHARGARADRGARRRSWAFRSRSTAAWGRRTPPPSGLRARRCS